MAIIAPIKDGIVQDTTASSNTSSTSTKKSNSELDKDAFLQLLVAQMKYQDPMEPTANTEYIAQLATFSELEAMQNLQASQSQEKATSLTGENVIMKVTSSTTGETSYISGKVDYVVIENGKAFLSINEQLYSIDDLDTVVSDEYLDATEAATNFKNQVTNLPSEQTVTLDDKEAVVAARKAYEALSTYAKKFVSSDAITKMQNLEAKIKLYESEADK
ncbi:flagellar hook capping FlgD N-terminal domain-containing protein [Anaerosacchariphilus polymeriproducens]|uniref:Basal-body rod modification protein FlgD n=1 Tax=Anaerosacchariphilus polymeriproducens TaxID=1812858 RepID=A0A371ASI7_9FIRM|nr:flagellar hook capping FlgD N-terminal domain-containing protein [Anaerosacchariphilus polymeriproducens]RDU22430.1 flagellar hook capping protein [Anaerosacchariphilus polymeriproducens]